MRRSVITVDVSRAADEMAAWDFVGARSTLEAALRKEDGGLDGLTARRMLAEVLRELGATARAQRLARSAVEETRRRYGDGHPATVRAVAVLATTCHDRGELDEAERLYGLLVDGRPDGPAGRAVLLARANLALLRRDRGDQATAVRDLTMAYTLHRRAYGAADLETVRLAAELGRLQADAGDLPAARRLLAVAHANARGALGEEHPLTGAIEGALAEVEYPMPPPPDEDPPRRRSSRAARATRTPRSARRTHAARPDRAAWLPRLAWLPRAARPRAAWVPRPVRDGRSRRVARGPVTVHTGFRPRRRRGVGTAIGVAGCLLALGAAAYAVVWATGARPGVAAPPAATASTATGATTPLPSDLALRDDGSRITATWHDPSGGRAAVLIAVAKAGQPTGPLVSLPAGTQTYAFTGLDAFADYCVVLAVAYPGERMTQATQACTHRHSLVDTAQS